jgi:GTP cyclohydrolase III
MVRVFDEADYRRRLDQAAEISTGDEIKLIIKGWVTGEGSGPLDAQKAMNEAKQNALRKARKEMLQAIRAEDDRYRSNAIIPIDVTELATGKSDELVQVP